MQGQARLSLSLTPRMPGWVPGTGQIDVVTVGPQDLMGHTLVISTVRWICLQNTVVPPDLWSCFLWFLFPTISVIQKLVLLLLKCGQKVSLTLRPMSVSLCSTFHVGPLSSHTIARKRKSAGQ